jgi:hypothetical protein
MAGGIRDLEVESDSEDEAEYEEEEINVEPCKQSTAVGTKSKGVFSLFR